MKRIKANRISTTHTQHSLIRLWILNWCISFSNVLQWIIKTHQQFIHKNIMIMFWLILILNKKLRLTQLMKLRLISNNGNFLIQTKRKVMLLISLIQEKIKMKILFALMKILKSQYSLKKFLHNFWEKTILKPMTLLIHCLQIIIEIKHSRQVKDQENRVRFSSFHMIRSLLLRQWIIWRKIHSNESLDIIMIE